MLSFDICMLRWWSLILYSIVTAAKPLIISDHPKCKGLVWLLMAGGHLWQSNHRGLFWEEIWTNVEDNNLFEVKICVDCPI